jgi:hypothetical protein
MFTIMWNPRGFHVIDKLPGGVTMNANYFTENILGPIEEKYSQMEGRRMEGDLSSYGQRSRSQLCDDNNFPCRSQYGAAPTYSPDLAPSDFYLFSTVKEKLKDIEMVDEVDLFYRLQELLNDIPIRELRKVFTAWIKRLVDASKRDGSYGSQFRNFPFVNCRSMHQICLPQRLINHTIP